MSRLTSWIVWSIVGTAVFIVLLLIFFAQTTTTSGH